MPKRQPLQTTFEGGVISPLLFNRSDLPGYHKAAKAMLNMYPDSRGPAINRSGFEYKADVADAADRFGRLFTFRVSYNQTFIVAITETSVWISDKNGLVASVNKILNGDFSADSANWITDTQSEGSVIFPSNICRLSSGSDKSAAKTGAFIEQNVVDITPGNTHSLRVDSQSISLNPGDILKVEIGTTQGGNDVLNRNISTVTNFKITFTPTTTDIWLRLSVEGTFLSGGVLDPDLLFLNNVRDVDVVSITDNIVDPNPGFVEFPSPWTEDQLHDLQAEMAPDLQRMYFAHRGVAVQKLELDITVTPPVWSFQEVDFDWTPGVDPWQTEFPGAITFFQSRLYLAATVSNPVTIWGSKPGSENYEDFSDAGGIDPDDPIKVILARNADIQWMQGSKVLYIGTDNSEHIITSDGPAVVNLDIETQQQSAYGSARIKTDWISNSIAFTTLDGKRLRLTNFDSNTRNMDSIDISFMSEHLARPGIIEIQHVANPINRIWATLANGTLLSCTIEKDRDVTAWAPHTTQGLIQSITVSEEQGQSVIYALVLRDSRLRLLRLGRKEIFMDEYVERGLDIPGIFVGGLEHLEGQTVQIVGDGNLYPNQVVEGGQVEAIGIPASDFVIGLPLPRMLETMPVDDVMQSTSTRASKKSWNRIFVRVLESVLPNINGKRPPDRSPKTLMNEREPNRTQDVIVQNVGWDYDGTITVSQDLPFNLIVTGVYGEISEDSF